MLSSGDLSRIHELLGREPSEVEKACFENLWSEHCSYRSTRTFLRNLPTQGKNVIIGPGDDAAVVRFSDDLALVVGMESHNHPSYVDPYHGAATGVGGIVRDVVSMGGRPIALMDPLYFGPLTREKNRYLFEHVVSGIGDYGNCIGVPVVRGEVIFDEGYSGNPLVNVVCIGTVHPDRYITGHAQRIGSRLVLVGSSTGRDGLGGASFASRDLSEDASEEDRPSVQIGDPYTEKLIIDAVLEMAKTGYVISCKDLGAAGLAGASSELCSTFGALIRLEQVHLREPNMRPAEIMLSESQERMVLEVAPEHVPDIGRIAEKYDLRWSEIGEVIGESVYRVTYQGEVVCDLPIALLTGDAPACSWEMTSYRAETVFQRPPGDMRDLALGILSHPDVAGKEWVFEQYDHDVQLHTVSIGGDAAVLRLGDKALVLSCGCNPRHIHLSPYAGTANAVMENVSNLACAGATPLCLVNCLNFASPVHPHIYWQLEQSTHGLGDMARILGVPVVGGNVSLYNESDEFSTQIKPTPSIGVIGKGNLISQSPPSDGDELALDAISGCGGAAPPIAEHAVLSAVRSLVEEKKVQGITDLSCGGLIAALTRLAPRSTIDLGEEMFTVLFSESYGRFLLAFRNESQLAGLTYSVLGKVGGETLTIKGSEGGLILSPAELREAGSTITRIMRHAWL
jgi:phosphoribosylformylglycinamidine synthase II